MKYFNIVGFFRNCLVNGFIMSVQEFGDYRFGEIDFPGIHVSERHSTNCEGYYNPLTKLLLPDNHSNTQTCSTSTTGAT